MNSGENIKRLREAKGLSQAALAEKIGVTRQMVAHYEAGSQPSRRIERRLAEALDVPVVTFDPFAASKEDVTEQDFDGWQIDGDAAHFWDGGDVPKLTLLLPKGFELTDDVKALLEKAYDVGFSHGLESGRWTTQHEIRRALGLT